MSSPHDTDDLYRYIESLQRQLQTPGWEEFHNLSRMKAWFAENLIKFDGELEPQYGDLGSPAAHLEKLSSEFEPRTRFDSPLTQATFGPLLADITLAAECIGIKVNRPIHLATSADVAASPAARPTEGPHYLFIGLGTSSFCNYWAKAFTAIIRALANNDPFRRVSQTEEVEAALKKDPSGILLAARLAFAYGAYGSALGFGQIVQPTSYLPYRTQILQAMEVFVVGHEFSHLIAEERIAQFGGFQTPEASINLEHFCDHLALQISREYANKVDNYLAFAGIGPLLFFRAMEMSEFARDRIGEIRQSSASPQLRSTSGEPSKATHPSLSQRIAEIKSLTISLTAEDQRDGVAAFIEEYDLIASCLVSLVKDVFPKAG